MTEQFEIVGILRKQYILEPTAPSNQTSQHISTHL